MKYCFIVQYYGEFPIWFPLFLKSCEHNKGIDWLFFVDREYKKDAPPNVKFHLQNSDDFQKVCVDKFGHEVKLMCYKGRKGKVKGFYKLCDYRPMYGFLFEDYLKNYDYWGWCDIDMIFGDLFNYVESIADNGYECIAFADYPDALPYGPCTLIRNSEKMNKLFMKSRDIQKVLTEERHFQFDEDWREDVHSIGHVMQDEGVNFLRTSVGNDDAKNRGHGENSGVKRNWKVNWKMGKLFHRKREVMFFHFGQTKQWMNEEFDFTDICKYNDIWFNYETLEGSGECIRETKPIFEDRRRERWMKSGSPAWYVKNFAHWLLWHYEHENIIYPKDFKRPKKSKVVLVERQTRVLLNHTAVENTLHEYCEQHNIDFVNIDTATISVDEQIDLFKNATTIIGVHGAGLANCFWMPPESSYCEFTIEHWPLIKGKNHHEGMIWNDRLIKGNFNVTRFLCEKEKSEQYYVESRNRRITEWRDWNLYVDIDRLEKQLGEIVV